MDFIGIAVSSMVSVFSPSCLLCGASVLEKSVRVNEETSAYNRSLVLDITCWHCGVVGKAVIDFLRTYIYDLEGPFRLNEKIKIKERKKKVPRTKIPKPLVEEEILLEAWTILQTTR